MTLDILAKHLKEEIPIEGKEEIEDENVVEANTGKLSQIKVCSLILS